jgi:diaminopimelate decarboxylase
MPLPTGKSSLDPVCSVDPSSYIGKKDLGECLRASSGGNVTFGDLDVIDFAQTNGTRHYLVDLKQVSGNARRLVRSFREYPGKFRPYYAIKANSLQPIVERIVAEGFGTETTNTYEFLFSLDLLKKRGRRETAPRIVCNGVAKHQAQRPYKDSLIEIAFGNQLKEGYDIVVNLSSMEEISFAKKLAHKLGGVLRVGVGVNPAIKPKTAEDLATGAGYTRFGVPLGSIIDIVKDMEDSGGLKVTQLHCHLGSQISNLDAIVGTDEKPNSGNQGLLQALCSKIFELEKKVGVHIDQLNIGGGIPVRYVKTQPSDFREYGEFWPSYDVEKYASEVTSTLRELYDDEGVALPELVIEPGRWLTANATALLLTVTDVFEVPGDFRASLKGADKWIITDGSAMTDAHDAVLLQQWFEIINISKIGKPLEGFYNIGGIACDSGDVFAWGRDRTGPRKLPKTEKGDILMVLDVGAYQQALSSNYNMLPAAPTYNIT